MKATALYETEFERRQHLSAIHNLATNFGVPEDSVRRLYEHELLSLKARARVKDFLSILVLRKMKEKCHDGSAGNVF